MPPQHDKRQTLMVAVLWMMLMAMPSMADKAATKGGQDADNGEQVFAELVAGTRPVLLFTKVPDHSLLVVGSSGATMATTNLEDTYVFKVASSSTSVLLKEKKKIKSAWAKLTGPYTAMFAVGESIVLVDGSGASVLDTKSGAISKMSLGKAPEGILQTYLLLSSSKTPTFYYINPNDKSEFTKAAFDTPNLVQATQIGPGVARHLCNSGHDQIKIQMGICQKGSVSWTILACYVDDTDFTLIEQGNSIIRFSKATFESGDGSPVSLHHIAANQFWRYSKPTAPPTAKHNALPSTTASSSLGIIIAVVCVVLLLLIIVGVAVYCIYFKKQKKPSSKGLKVTSSAKSLSKSTSKVPSKQSRRSGSRSMKKQNSVHKKATVNRSKISDVRSKSAAGISSWNSFYDRFAAVKSKDTITKFKVAMTGPDRELISDEMYNGKTQHEVMQSYVPSTPMMLKMRKKRPSRLTGVWPKKMGSARKVVNRSKRGAASSKRSLK